MHMTNWDMDATIHCIQQFFFHEREGHSFQETDRRGSESNVLYVGSLPIALSDWKTCVCKDWEWRSVQGKPLAHFEAFSNCPTGLKQELLYLIAKGTRGWKSLKDLCPSMIWVVSVSRKTGTILCSTYPNYQSNDPALLSILPFPFPFFPPSASQESIRKAQKEALDLGRFTFEALFAYQYLYSK